MNAYLGQVRFSRVRIGPLRVRAPVEIGRKNMSFHLLFNLYKIRKGFVRSPGKIRESTEQTNINDK